MLSYSTFLVNAHRPAMEAANSTSLPQTVFYHPDWGYSHTNVYAKILRDKQTMMHVTWLPERYNLGYDVPPPMTIAEFEDYMTKVEAWAAKQRAA